MSAADLRAVASRFPSIYQPELALAMDRVDFQLQLVKDRTSKTTLVDLGGGDGFFAAACASVGITSTVIDDYRDNEVDHSELWRVLESLGVKVIQADFIRDVPRFPDGSLDIVTSFDALEHVHHSPKGLLHAMSKALKPGGLFVIGVPNAVNIRKRVAVLMGRNNWSYMSEWYEKPVFRSHVREPSVDDLLYMARDLKLRHVEIIGRNFQGFISPRPLTRKLTAVADRILRFRPSLCSDIYLVGRT